MDFKQRYVSKFFPDEGMPGVKIVAPLRHHDGECVLSRAQVYFWIYEVKRGRTDLMTITSPGKELDEGLAAVITGKLDASLRFSTRKFAQSLEIAASTVCRYLTEVLGM
jgi:hypothetical protein